MMTYGSIRLEGNLLYSVSKPHPIHLDHVEYMYVKRIQQRDRMIHAGLYSFVLSSLLMVSLPLLGVIGFSLLFAHFYGRAKPYELRVFVRKTHQPKAQEICLHKSRFRDEYDAIVEKVKTIKTSQE